MAKLKIKLVKSLAGRKEDQIATAKSLGLRKIGDDNRYSLTTLQHRAKSHKISTSSR